MKKHTENNFLAYLIILWALFILIFFTKGIYQEIQEKSDAISMQDVELSSQRAELTRLRQLQQDLLAEDSEADKEIKWFSWEYSDENIINHIYSYAQKTNLWDDRIIIRNISLSGEEKSDLWFNKANINLDVITSWEDTLFEFLNYLTSDESEFKFYITSFDYNLWVSSSNITVNIPLTFYYK